MHAGVFWEQPRLDHRSTDMHIGVVCAEAQAERNAKERIDMVRYRMKSVPLCMLLE